MPLFGGKHYSNPAVGRSHEGMNEGGQEAPQEHAEPAKSYHVFHHEDGTAHSHIHHASGEHEHTDHASHEEAHDHVAKALGDNEGAEGEGESFKDWAKEEETEPEHKMSMHNAARMGGGAF